jgi:tetratricopeptide repeat protein 8
LGSLVATATSSLYVVLFAENAVLLLGKARIHDALNDIEASLPLYKQVLQLDASNVEAMACVAAHHFYTDQPEIALRLYRYDSTFCGHEAFFQGI